MTFRKMALTTRAFEISSAFFAMLSATLFRISGMWICFFSVIVFIIAIFEVPIQNNELITINENGIVCKKSEKQIWAYSWDEIDRLERSNRFCRPSIEIVTLDDPYQPARSNHFFELCRKAEEAMRLYYKT